jgi:predicted flavoprotein YhiN
VPQTGSDGTGLRILEALGHTLNPTYPALTPLTLYPNPFAELAGVSLPVTITSGAGKKAFRTTGSFLFTHRGFSGPAALNASHVVIRRAAPARPSGAARGAPPHDAPTTHAPPLAGSTLFVSWGPLTRADWERELIGGTRHVVNVLKAHLPERLAEHLYRESGIAAERSVAQLRKEERARLLELLTAYPLPVTGDEGYKKAEVTGGGAALEEFVTQSLESRKHPGLFVCGEALDCFGPIGGYNFHWAWATGRVAGEGAGAR